MPQEPAKSPYKPRAPDPNAAWFPPVPHLPDAGRPLRDESYRHELLLLSYAAAAAGGEGAQQHVRDCALYPAFGVCSSVVLLADLVAVPAFAMYDSCLHWIVMGHCYAPFVVTVAVASLVVPQQASLASPGFQSPARGRKVSRHSSAWSDVVRLGLMEQKKHAVEGFESDTFTDYGATLLIRIAPFYVPGFLAYRTLARL